MRRAYRKRELVVLKSAIKGLSQEIKDCYRKKALLKKGKERAYGRYELQDLKVAIRFHYLAYALMTGKRYDQIEEKRPFYTECCPLRQEQAAEKLIKVIATYLPYHFAFYHGLPSKEHIIHWFKTGENYAFQNLGRRQCFFRVIPKKKKMAEAGKEQMEDKDVS